MCACVLIRFSCVPLFRILWTVACQSPHFMGFSRQEYWSGLPCPPPHGGLHNPGTEAASPGAPALQDSLLLSHWGSIYIYVCMYIYMYVCQSFMVQAVCLVLRIN